MMLILCIIFLDDVKIIYLTKHALICLGIHSPVSREVAELIATETGGTDYHHRNEHEDKCKRPKGKCNHR